MLLINYRNKTTISNPTAKSTKVRGQQVDLQLLEEIHEKGLYIKARENRQHSMQKDLC